MTPTPRAVGERPAAGAPRAGCPGLDVERALGEAGHRWVAGIDEVGRGAWAGPLSVGVVIVDTSREPGGVPPRLRDSKAIAEARREGVFADVAAWCEDAAVGHATPSECDQLGMTRAWRLAARRALASLEIAPGAAVIDGPYDLLHEPDPSFDLAARPDPACGAVAVPETVVALAGADRSCASVAAASVIAKVVRDRIMRAESAHFPPYAFEQNKGYPSARHQIALRGYGLSSIHRRSWSYVAGLPWR